MYTALYYPHTQIADHELLKTALLLWDGIEYIVPWDGFRTTGDGDVGRALELVAQPYFPSDEDKRQAHEAILELATAPLPQSFLLDQVPPGQEYLIYSQKLLRDTWEALFDLKLVKAQSMGEFDDMAASTNLGLAVMGLLAECCAGSTKRRVTDQTHAYEVVAKSIVGLHGGSFGNVREDVESLVTISLEIVDCSSLDLHTLIEYREREEASGGHNLRALRHGYLRKIDSFVRSLSETKGHMGDRRETLRMFRQTVKDDLAGLREALKLKATDTLLSKEVGVGLLAAAGVAVAPVSLGASILGVGSLLRSAKLYNAERRRVLRDNAMSWLLSLTQTGIQAY